MKISWHNEKLPDTLRHKRAAAADDDDDVDVAGPAEDGRRADGRR